MPAFETSIDDALGLWSSTSIPMLDSFGIPDEVVQPGEQIYKVNLPANVDDAGAVFNNRELVFARVNDGLRKVPSQLDALVNRTLEKRQQQAAGVSFSAAPADVETGPEAELLALLDEVDSGVNVEDNREISFGLEETASGAWQAAKAGFDGLVVQIDRDVLHFAWVETSLSSRLIARTTIEWSGDAQTVWNADFNRDQSALHERTLSNVTQTRLIRLRMFVTIASGAAKVAGLLATPGGALLALPAVYQYVTKIVAQARELQTIQIS